MTVRAAAGSTLYSTCILCTYFSTYFVVTVRAEGVQASKSVESHACGRNCLHSKVDPTVRTYPLVVT